MKKSNTYCSAPFQHLHISPIGDMMPCCSYKGKPFGNVNNNSIENIFNNVRFKIIRKQLLEGKEPDGCEKCYKRESVGLTSPRLSYQEVYKPSKNYTMPIKFDSWDIRNTNLCNLKCQTCGPVYSSLHNNNLEIRPSNKAMKDIYQNIDNNIDNVKYIYFAGGEPLINPMHEYIIKKLIDKKRFDCKLQYSTNLTLLKYKGFDVLEAWKKFKNVKVLASIDGIGKQNEFIRTNSKWETTDKNLKILLGQSNIDLRASICVSNLNIHNLHVICDYLLNIGLEQHQISPNNILIGPEKFCIKNTDINSLTYLRKYIKKNRNRYPIIIKDLEKVIEWIKNN